MSSVERVELVELIESEAAKLSPQGRELWERLELIAEQAPETATLLLPPPLPPYPEQLEIGERMGDLPWHEQGILERLVELLAGLRSSDYAEKRGDPGEPRRNLAVIVAAGIKDRRAGRPVDPDMTPERAAAWLREPG